MNILFEDDNIIVAVKPAGFSSEKSGCENMPGALQKINGEEVYTVHRLDRETSGVMVYAKTKSAAAVLSKQLAEGGFDKIYLARIHGCPQESEGIFEDLLFHDKNKNKSYAVKRERAGVKKAKLAYTVKEKNDDNSLVSIKLYTGRTHQIRVQFASRGMPLFGDRKYGAKDSCPLALRCVYLGFKHPVTGDYISYSLNSDGI